MKKYLFIFVAVLFGCESISVVEPEKPNISGVWKYSTITLYLSQESETTFNGDFYFDELFISEVKGKIIDGNYIFSTSQSTYYDNFTLGFTGKLIDNTLSGKLNGSVLNSNIVIGFGNISVVFTKQ
ncbi:hypothetical protein [Methanoregula sp.]|jgi:hypothetical protein|uniref:hypothetical protein n=1 Tax=Methanoregula sp. TaxID=2052170 RepID=UPI0035661D74